MFKKKKKKQILVSSEKFRDFFRKEENLIKFVES